MAPGAGWATAKAPGWPVAAHPPLASAAQPSSTPASRMALVPRLSSRFSKIQPKVRVWMSIGTTIIMLMMPM